MPTNQDASKLALESHHSVSRLSPPDPSRLPDSVQKILEDEAQRFGAPLNTTTVWTHHPALLAAYKAWGKAMNDATMIPASLKYLIYVRVASLNGCPF